MAEVTDIEWADSTFNPWMGCTKVSPACDHCYAETLMDTRYGKVKWGPHGERVRTSVSNWQNPRRWQRQAATFFAEHGRRRRVFCASLADVFDNRVPVGWRADLWDIIRETPDLDWLLLTKRPQNIGRMLPEFWDHIRDRVWLGTSTENQAETNRRLPHLLAVSPRPAVFFASAEPLLGPIDFRRIPMPEIRYETGIHYQDVLRAGSWAKEPFFRPSQPDESQSFFTNHSYTEHLDWIIAGGESGPGARPTHPKWIRSIRDQCAEAGVAFLFKQHGEWAPMAHPREKGDIVLWPNGRTDCTSANEGGGAGWPMRLVGKKVAGRFLDGVTHDAFPEARP